MKIALLFAVSVVACGGGSSNGDPPVDVLPDTPEIDAPMDGLTTHRFVISALRVPANNNQARDYALDLDGDAVVDNQMGMVLATLAGQGLSQQATVTTAVDKGEILMLGELRADSLVQSTMPASFVLRKGANPTPAPCAGAGDTTCRKHLTGTASFSIAPDSAQDTPLAGAVVGGTLTAGPGHLRLIANLVGGAPIALDLVGARVKLTMLSPTGIGVGVLAGGITQAEMDAKIYPGMLANGMAAVAASCTGSGAECGCAPGSAGKTWLALFDTMPTNCTLTLEEIRNNSLIQSLFAPDVTLEGQAALSVGLQITAVGAKFVQ